MTLKIIKYQKEKHFTSINSSNPLNTFMRQGSYDYILILNMRIPDKEKVSNFLRA